MKQPAYTKEQALLKLQHYCAWQERCHSEVKEKLGEMGLKETAAAEILARLIEENYLNEERFAKTYAGSKFRMKQWGRRRIIQALKQKQVSEYCIRKGLEEIDAVQYKRTMEELAQKKWTALKTEKNIYAKMAKTRNYLLQKGFEADLVMEHLQQLQQS